MAKRIQADLDSLEALGDQMQRAARELQQLSARMAGVYQGLRWETGLRGTVEDRVNQACRLAGRLSGQADELGRFLARGAEALESADHVALTLVTRQAAEPGTGLFGQVGQWAGLVGTRGALASSLEPWAGLTTVFGPAAATAAGTVTGVGWMVGQHPELFRTRPAGTAPPAPVTPPAAEPVPASPAPPTGQGGELEAMLGTRFPRPEDQLIIKHTIAREGPGKFGASWGGVVYRSQNGQLLCDRQWLNFGLISFAYPAGSAGGVLRQVLGQPAEEAAFREIALRTLQDSPGGTVPDGWTHLLNRPGDAEIAATSKEALVDQFIANIKSGDDRAAQDWMFKYTNVPTTRSDVATGALRDDWQQLFREFLSRPSSQVAQLATARGQYFDAAVQQARDLFGLETVRGVGFLFDATVQGGGATEAMVALAGTEAYQQASEIGKLEMLRDTFTEGSTEWHRRSAVLQSQSLTDQPYPFD